MYLIAETQVRKSLVLAVHAQLECSFAFIHQCSVLILSSISSSSLGLLVPRERDSRELTGLPSEELRAPPHSN